MDKTNREQGRKCFIITPIGSENSDIFRKAKGVIESVIKPVLKEYGFDDIKPAYEINVSGMINTQIINRIIDDDLVVANLTGNNPNVMYELCLRHVVAKPIIHICESGTSLPFDIKDNRTIFYTNDMLGVEELKDVINKFMCEMDFNAEYMDNPVYSAYKYGKLLKETQGTETNEILKMLMDISGKLTEIEPSISITYRSLDESPVYTVGEFHKDIGSIDRRKAQKVLRQNNNHKMYVYELARELNTETNVIINIAQTLNIDVTSPKSIIEHGDIERILNCICNGRLY